MSFNIAGTGMYVPEKVITNDDLAQIVDTNDEWIRKRVGIHERHISVDETAAQMGFQAAQRALDNAGVDKNELDLILAATVSGETVSPSTACMIQHYLGVDCMAYDINAACSAFIFLLETAAGYFARGKAKKVLVVGTERMSRILDWDDRSTCVIFGDGAGAAVLTPGEGYQDSVFRVAGGDDVINIPQFIGKSPWFTPEPIKPYIHMEGQETFKFAVNSITSDITKIMERNGLTPEDIDHVVLHQANRRIIDFAISRLKMDAEKFHVNIQHYGNTSSASVPIALDELNRQGRLKKGDRIILSAFGGGLASASCLIQW
ncbi:MAG: ketoacyl-ACP synthase III [Clostridiales bacterium]|nr:ketoacyl-ACP synthase III [Clostridiales bacterium]